MIWLSELVLHPRDLLVLRDLGDVSQLHRTVMRAWPDVATSQPRRALGVLFRLEARARPPVVLVQSRERPDWGRLPAGYLLAQRAREITSVLDALEPGRLLRFRLVANPTLKTRRHRPQEAPPRNSRRIALTSDVDRLAWLERRAASSGFALVGNDPAHGVRVDTLPPSPPAPRRDGGIFVRPVAFEGVMRITDSERLRAALAHGIGPAKAYGCGLLSLAPLR